MVSDLVLWKTVVLPKIPTEKLELHYIAVVIPALSGASAILLVLDHRVLSRIGSHLLHKIVPEMLCLI